MLLAMPEAAFVPDSLLHEFPPRADLLLQECSRLVDDKMLREIASADYDYDLDNHLRALRRIRDDQHIDVPMDWEPKEVLELTRWLIPENAEEDVQRAFSCAALLVFAAAPDAQEYEHSEFNTLISLVHSALALGQCLPQASAQFFTWRLTNISRRSYHIVTRGFYSFALACLACLTKVDRFTSDQWSEIASWVEREVAADVEALEGSFMTDTGWLLSNDNMMQQQCIDLWREIAEDARENAAHVVPPPARAMMIELFRRVATHPK